MLLKNLLGFCSLDATQSVISELLLTTMASTKQKEQCCICLEFDPWYWVIWPCGHQCCFGCQMRLVKTICPLCRNKPNLQQLTLCQSQMDWSVCFHVTKVESDLRTFVKPTAKQLGMIECASGIPAPWCHYQNLNQSEEPFVHPLKSYVDLTDGRKLNLLEYHMTQYPFKKSLPISYNIREQSVSQILQHWCSAHGHPTHTWRDFRKYVVHEELWRVPRYPVDLPSSSELHQWEQNISIKKDINDVIEYIQECGACSVLTLQRRFGNDIDPTVWNILIIFPGRYKLSLQYQQTWGDNQFNLCLLFQDDW